VIESEDFICLGSASDICHEDYSPMYERKHPNPGCRASSKSGYGNGYLFQNAVSVTCSHIIFLK
jgi:hypothetical protein